MPAYPDPNVIHLYHPGAARHGHIPPPVPITCHVESDWPQPPSDDLSVYFSDRNGVATLAQPPATGEKTAVESPTSAAIRSSPVREHFGMFVVQDRVGLHGKIIKICKIKTMRNDVQVPQALIDEADKNGPAGRIVNDPRITKLGRILRPLTIDEFPQILSLLKGDLKLVGVRPLSAAEFAILPHSLKAKRLATKPALVNALLGENIHGTAARVAAEEKYLDQWREKPFTTSVKAFGRVAWAMICGKRSV